jgi:gamma-glutamylcyclotransferase (GGCT)/AIG2-like uncharacterized protein YtfP
MSWYFAYGRNMNHDVMLTRKAPFSREEKAILKGYKLTFNKVRNLVERSGFANIIPDKEESVEGIVYEVTSAGIATLDGFEGYPAHYLRNEIVVSLESGEKIEAIAYVANKNKCKNGLKPKKEYLMDIITGAEQHNLSKQYIEKLKKTETID